MASDIFAFGQVAVRLLPGEPALARCASDDAAERPASLAPVIEALQPKVTRRYWIAGAAIASAAAVRYAFAPPAAGTAIPANATVLVNGFGASAEQREGARLVRSLVVTSLRQSPRIHSISDEDFLPAVHRMGFDAQLPLTGQKLHSLLAELRAAFWVDGDMRRSGSRYSLDLRLLNTAGAKVIRSSVFRDLPNLMELAKSAALWVRTTAGESTESLTRNSNDLHTWTSAVTEALEKYFDALEHYALGEIDLAVPLLEEAVRLDPNFAQAHNMLALVLNSVRQYDRAFDEIAAALRLSPGLPPRERNSIELTWYRMTDDPKMIEASAREAANFPAEPRSWFQLGRSQASSGIFDKAAENYRKALVLSPGDWTGVVSLGNVLAEAGRFQEAISESQVGLSKSSANNWIYEAYGNGLLGLERYEEAAQAFSRMPAETGNFASIQIAGIMQGRLQVALSAMQEQQGRAVDNIGAFRASEFLCGLNFVMGNPTAASSYLRRMAQSPILPSMGSRLGCAASWARRLGDREVLGSLAESAATISTKWPNGHSTWVAHHIRALEQWMDNAAGRAAEGLARCIGEGFGVWPVFDLAELCSARGDWPLARRYWQEFENLRGVVFVQGWFPGAVVLGWLNQAVAAQMQSLRADAYMWSKKVLDHWGAENPRIPAVIAAGRINSVSLPL
jgi:tetratricopeptide (TPR) repeat protein